MFVRFVSTIPDDQTGRPVGIFQAAYRLRDARDTPLYYEAIIREHLNWFSGNLQAPSRFSRARNTKASPIALCWFKPSVTMCIDRARELAYIVNELAFPVTTVTSNRPGMIVYEDDFQIAALPFRGKK